MERGANPTIALSYFGRAYSGDAPDLDTGSFQNSLQLLASADVKGFHYDTNYIFDEVVNGAVRRAQFGQTLSVSHPLGTKFGISGKILALHSAFSTRQCHRQSVGAQLQRTPEPCV